MVRTLYFVVSVRNIVFRTIFQSGEGQLSPRREAKPRGETGSSCYCSVIGREVSRQASPCTYGPPFSKIFKSSFSGGEAEKEPEKGRSNHLTSLFPLLRERRLSPGCFFREQAGESGLNTRFMKVNLALFVRLLNLNLFRYRVAITS